MKENIQKLFKEMIPVILGILIALLINNWKEERDNEQFVNNVLSSISKELEENKKELEEKIMQHETLLDTIQYYLNEEDIVIRQILGKMNGVKLATIKNTSWKSFLNPNIELVDYDLISELTNIEEGKQNMKVQMEKMMSFVYENIGTGDYVGKETFKMIIGDLTYTEKGLLESHDKFLKLCENNNSMK